MSELLQTKEVEELEKSIRKQIVSQVLNTKSFDCSITDLLTQYNETLKFYIHISEFDKNKTKISIQVFSSAICHVSKDIFFNSLILEDYLIPIIQKRVNFLCPKRN